MTLILISCCAHFICSISVAGIELCRAAWCIQAVSLFVYVPILYQQTHILFSVHDFEIIMYVCQRILQSIKKKLHYITMCDCLQKIMVDGALKGSSQFITLRTKAHIQYPELQFYFPDWRYIYVYSSTPLH